MNWPASILVGLCAASLTAVVVGVAADSWMSWLSVPAREGRAATYVGIAPLPTDPPPS